MCSGALYERVFVFPLLSGALGSNVSVYPSALSELWLTCGLSSIMEQKGKSAHALQFTSSNLYLHYIAPHQWKLRLDQRAASNDYFHC